jgi:hypothetical protein
MKPPAISAITAIPAVSAGVICKMFITKRLFICVSFCWLLLNKKGSFQHA